MAVWQSGKCMVVVKINATLPRSSQSKAYKNKIKGLIGGKKILETCGWKKDPANSDRMLLGGGEDEADIDWNFLKSVKEQLAKALVESNNDV